MLVMLIALPLLRPLRAPTDASQTERLLLDTVKSLSTRGGLQLSTKTWAGQPGTVQVKGKTYADRPPTFAVLLAGPEWVMRKAGLNDTNHGDLIAYLLTFFGTTVPVALGGGIIYRMGRLFELSRPKRALLALLVTFGGGWISYATVLNPHAPAAAAVVGASACMLYLAAAKRSAQMLPIMLLSGLLAATAAALSPWTLPLVLPLPLVLFAMSIPVRQKVIGFALLTLGAMPIAWVHAAWSIDAFGSLVAPGSMATLNSVVAPTSGPPGGPADTVMDRATSLAGELFNITLGNHGFLTHFPLMIVGIAGLIIVLRKHWPMHAKMLAAITLVGMTTIIMLVASRRQGIGGWMFGVQWFVVFLPLLAFFAGAVLRRDMSTRTGWAVTAAAALSVIVSLAGAGWPLPTNDPYASNTAVGAIERWLGVGGDEPSRSASARSSAVPRDGAPAVETDDVQGHWRRSNAKNTAEFRVSNDPIC